MRPRQLFYALCAVLVALVIGGGTLYYLMQSHLQDGITALSQKEAESELLDQKLSHLDDLNIQYQRIAGGSSPLLPIINKALPATKNETEIAIQLRNLANDSGMKFSGLKFPDSDVPSDLSQTVKAGPALALPLSFELTGTYEQLQQFLDRQEHLSRYTSITSLTITTAPGGTVTNQRLNFTINLNAYIKP